jgi:hypothetical protein
VIYLSAAGFYQLLANIKDRQAAHPNSEAISTDSASP